MPAALDVNREAVKTLAIAVGMKQASEQTGIPYGAIRQWANRESWFRKPAQPPTKIAAVTDVTKPSEALAAVIAENKLHTRSGLAQYSADAAQKLAKSKGNLRNSRPAKDIADIMSKLWPEQSGAGTTINMALLCDQAAIQVVSQE